MYKYEQIQLDVKAATMINELSSDDYKKQGLPENFTTLEHVTEKYRAYLADVMAFCKVQQEIEDIHEKDAKVSLSGHVIYEEQLRQEVADTLLRAPDTTPEIKKQLISFPDVWSMLGRVVGSSYEKRADNFFGHLQMFGEKTISEDEKKYLRAELEKATMPFDYERIDEFTAAYPKVYNIVNKMNEDNEEDFDFWLLWNNKYFKRLLTNEEIDALFKEILSHVTDEQLIDAHKNIMEHTRDNAARSL